MPVRILLVDDHAMFRQGVARILDAEPDFEIVGEANNGEDGCRLAKELEPDLILMDIHMPRMDGLQAIQTIMGYTHAPQIVVLTMSEDDDHIIEAIRRGASGYFLKNRGADELIAALRNVLNGQTILEPGLAQHVIREFRQMPAKSRPEKRPSEPLDEREIKILRGVVRGWTNQDIAEGLELSEKTIKNQLSTVFRKLNVDNRTQAAVYALRTGIVPLEDTWSE